MDSKKMLETIDNYILTPKQKKFCIEYILTGIGSISAEKAGYGKTNARQIANDLLNKHEVKACLNHLNRELLNDSIADIQEHLEKLTDTIRNREFEEVVFYDAKRGKVIRTNKRISMKDRLKALDQLAKIQGLYKDANTTTQINVKINDDIE